MIKKVGKNYYLKYTVIFSLMTLVVYGHFLYFGKSFIECSSGNNADGLIQHYTALCYYAKYLREIVKTLLFDHKLIIPEWSFSIGYGSDILTTLHYYVIGDPFNLLSVAVPLRFMPYYYSGMILVRMYCAGAAFSAFSLKMISGNEKKAKSHIAVLAGSLVYLFGLYGMTAGISHPYFINPMIYFPLLLLGVEKILRRENSFIFMITVAVSTCSNFYFFYMLVIFTVLYVLLRLVVGYRIHSLKGLLIHIWRVGIRAVIGLGTGMVVFLPVILTVFGDSRFGNTNLSMLFYPKKYYTQLLAGFVSGKKPGYWCLMGFAAIVLVAVILLFAQKEKKQLKIAFVCMTAFILIPAVNCVLNGFSYAASRWIWAYACLVAFIVVQMWPGLLEMKKKEAGYVGLGLLVYFVLCFLLDNSRTANLAFAMTCAFAVLCISGLEMGRIGRERLLLLMIVFNIGINSYYLFSYKATNKVEDYGDWDKVNTLVMDSFDGAVQEADAACRAKSGEKDEFFRFAHNIINNNATLLSGMYSTQYYWTLSNPAIIEFNNELGINGFTHNIYYDLNSRARLTSLANVKYFVGRKDIGLHNAPYGFDAVGTYQTGTGKYDVFRNNNALPFGYTYDRILNAEIFEGLSSVQKEEAMFQAAYLGNEEVDFPVDDTVIKTIEIPYEFAGQDEHVTIEENAFVTTKDGVTVVLNINGLEKSETFVRINGLTYQGCSPLELYQYDSPFDPQNRYTQEKWNAKSLLEQKEQQYKNRNWTEENMLYCSVNAADSEGNKLGNYLWLLTPNYTWYAGKEDYTANLRYSESGRVSVEITLPYAGIYSFEEIVVECMPIEGYEEGIQKLEENHLEQVVFGVDSIRGSIAVADDRLLCLTVPYSAGWKAYVDGNETKVYKTNYMYSGIILEEGEHEIVLAYATPGLRLGILISMISMVLMLAMTNMEHRRLK